MAMGLNLRNSEMTIELEGENISRPAKIACSSIDVGLIVYNEREMIGPTLDALLAAGFDSFVILDMQSTDGTVEYIHETLGQRAHIISYPRRSLIEYGYGEARNNCANFSTREWFLFVDADEVLVSGVEDGYVIINNHGETPDIYSIKRNNLERDPANGPDAAKVYSTEHHNRLYKPSFRMRYAGYIHEVVSFLGDPCHHTRGETALVFDHYSQLKKSVDLEQKEGLYSLMLLRLYNQPDVRLGTDAWWFDTYVPAHIAAITARAEAFARQQDFKRSFYGPRLRGDKPCTPGHVADTAGQPEAGTQQDGREPSLDSRNSKSDRSDERRQSVIGAAGPPRAINLRTLKRALSKVSAWTQTFKQ